MRQARAARFRRDDWLALGLRCLAAEGPAGVKLAALCRRGGRTRGSFYHHFEDMETFITALGEHWRQRNTTALIAQTQQGSAPSRLEALNALAVRLDPKVEVGMRRLAASHPTIVASLAAVDAERIDYLTLLWRASADLSHKRANELARIEYAALVGSQVLWPDGDPRLAEALGALLGRMLWAGAKK